jgi:TRAP-type mannitol/chloroaromatic compound transport system substrate-binding protein
MRYRTVLLSLAAVSLVAGGAAAPAAASGTIDGPEVTWNVSLWGAPRAFTEGFETIKQIVEERTEGRFQMTLHYGGAISPPRENLDGISIGAFEAAQVCAFYHPGKTLALTGLDLPFLPIRDIDHKADVSHAYFAHPAIVEELGRWNAVALAESPMPHYEFMGRGDPPTELEGWRGKRARVPGGLGRAMERIGAVPTSMPAPEVYNALERGIVDAASFPFSSAHVVYGLHEVSHWYTTNLRPGSPTCPMVANSDALAALPEAYRQLLVEEAAPEGARAIIAGYAADDMRNLPMIEARLKPVTYTEDQIAELRGHAEEVWEAWVAEVTEKGIPGRELLDHILSSARELLAGN